MNRVKITDIKQKICDRRMNYSETCSTPKGIRTPVASVKGRCPRPLDDGGEAVIVGCAPDHQMKLGVRLTLRQDSGRAVLILPLPDGNSEEEAGSFAWFGDHPDLAAVHFNDAPTD